MAIVVDKGVEKVVEIAVDSVWRQITYIIDFKTNIEELHKKVLLLEAERKSLEHQVTTAKNQGQQIEDGVKIWLNDADEAIKEAYQILKAADKKSKEKATKAVHEIQQAADETSKEKAIKVVDEKSKASCCFMGCHPVRNTRYLLSRKVKKEMLPTIDAVLERNKFTRIGYSIPVQELQLPRDYEVIQSRTEVLQKIVGALKTPNVNMIGLYGLGGVGKSTLLNQLRNEVKADGFFKEVIAATVTQAPSIHKIQQELADWLSFKFDVDSLDVRKTKLREQLEGKEKILIILDDIWGDHLIELEKVGIPYGDDHKGCKVLMSSRSQDALLKMKVKKDFSFRLDTLGEAEALSLFQKTVGTVEDEIKPILIEVAKRCGGLPLLIKAVAIALRSNQKVEWITALEDLRTFDDKGLEAQTYEALKLSFKYLKDEQKSLFILCSQLTPHNISIGNLLKYSIGLGLFNQHSRSLDGVESVLYRLLTAVNQLKKSCFLEEGDSSDMVTMHDLIHEFAALVASKEYHVFIGSMCKEWPNDETFEQFTAVSLLECKIPQLSQVLKCQQLQSFLLYNDDSSLKIPDCLFETKKTLKVLNFSNVNLLTLPSSLNSLVNLVTLCLDGCDLADISVVGELKNLQVLSIRNSTISRLPRELCELTKLQLLDLSGSRMLEVIPPNVLNGLTELEHLLLGDSFVRWEGEGYIGETKNVSLEELKRLLKLTNLEIHVLDPKILPVDLFSQKLERFNICIGEVWDYKGLHETSTTLKLQINTRNQLGKVKVPLMKTEDLYLDDLISIENVVPDIDRQGFPKLKHLHVQNSHYTQYITDWTMMGHAITFGRLESLTLYNLTSVKKICHGKFVNGSFEKLTTLIVDGCQNLECIFTASMVSTLQQLKHIEICNCDSVEEVVTTEGAIDEVVFLKLDSLKLGGLQKLVRFVASNLISCPSLKALHIERCNQLQAFVEGTGDESGTSSSTTQRDSALFDGKVLFPNLEEIHIKYMDKLKMIWNEELGSDSFSRLKKVKVFDCNELLKVFPSKQLRRFMNVITLAIQSCGSLEEVFDLQTLIKAKERHAVTATELRYLILYDLPKLKQVWNGDAKGILSFQNLSMVTVAKCPSLSILFPPSVARNLPQLKVLFLIGSGVDELVAEMEGSEANPVFEFPQLEHLCFLALEKLKHFYKGNHTFKCLKLKILQVMECGQIFGWENEKLKDKDMEIQPLFSFSQVNEVLQHLQHLTFDNLIHLVPSSVSFWNLITLKVYECHGLVSLLTSSTAKTLEQLTELYIGKCKEMTSIIADEGDVLKDEIIFSKLERLELDELTSLISFCSEDHNFKFPSLTKISLVDCPNMQFFSKRDLATPNLKEIYRKMGDVSKNEYKRIWRGNLNDTIRNLYEEQQHAEEEEE